LETIAIIPFGPLTIPLIRKLLIIRPGLPGGRLSGEPEPLISFPISGANGSRRAMFSLRATGRIVGAVAEVGTSAFAAVARLGTDGLAAEFADDSAGAFPRDGKAGLPAAAVALGAFGFIAEAAPLAVELAFAVTAPEADAEAADGLEAVEPEWAIPAAVDAGFAGCDFEFCSLETSGFAGAVEDGACFAAEPFAAELVAAGAGFEVSGLWGAAAGCWAATGIAREARQSAAAQIVRFIVRVILCTGRILNSVLPYLRTGAPGLPDVFEAVAGAAGALVVKKVVMVHVPDTVVLGRTG
jgi:hypothetical protein